MVLLLLLLAMAVMTRGDFLMLPNNERTMQPLY